jgi:hypothetical protein
MKAYVATVISSEMLLSVGNDMKIRQQNTYGSIYIYIFILQFGLDGHLVKIRILGMFQLYE